MLYCVSDINPCVLHIVDASARLTTIEGDLDEQDNRLTVIENNVDLWDDRIIALEVANIDIQERVTTVEETTLSIGTNCEQSKSKPVWFTLSYLDPCVSQSV